MKFSLNKLSKSEAELKIEISIDEFNDFYKKAIQNFRENLEIKGFRKGKAPAEVIKEAVGREKILTEATRLAVEENYLKAVSESKLEPLGRPKIEILKTPPSGSLEFKATISVFPKIELPDYKQIAAQVEKRAVEVSDKEIEDNLNWLRRSRAKFSQISRPAKKGDWVEIEFSSPQIEGGAKKQDAFILGEGNLIPGFEQKLEGMSAGEEAEFVLSFPEKHFQKDLAQKKALFRVKMKSIQKMELPELNDEFSQSLGRFKSLDELKKSLREGLKTEKEIAEENRLSEEIVKKILQNTDFEVPTVLTDPVKSQILEDLKQKIASDLKISFQDYLKKANKTESDLMKVLDEEAVARVKRFLVLKEIGRKEHVTVPDKEVEEETQNYLNRISPDKAKSLDLNELKGYIKETIKDKKVLQLLLHYASNTSHN